MEIQLEISICPSAARRGKHAIAISNGSGESLVLGYAETPEVAKEAIKLLFRSDDGWLHDESVNYHTLQVAATTTPVACVRSS